MTTALDLELGSVVRVVRMLPARRERVFRCWTEPALFQKWFGAPVGSTPHVDMDVRVGGTYRVAIKPPLAPVAYAVGTYLEVDPPTRLVFTFAWEAMPVDPGAGRVAVELSERQGCTELTLTHELTRGRASRLFHRIGWGSSLRRLRRIA